MKTAFNILGASVMGAALGLMSACADREQASSRPQARRHPEARLEDLKSQPEEYWKERLTAEQFQVTRKGGTERAFSGEYHNLKKPGTYLCVGCGQPLFGSEAKFDSGTGWPSFWDAISGKAVELLEDRGLFTLRTEVRCSRCGAHLGHVFNDGPPPTRKRYCINSLALSFSPKKAE